MIGMLAVGLAIFGIAFVAKRSERSYAAPIAAFAAMWGGYVLCGIMFRDYVDHLVDGMLWILASTLIMYVGSLVARPWSATFEAEPLEDTRGNPGADAGGSPAAVRRLRVVVGAGIGVGLLVLGDIVLGRGLSPLDLLSWAIITEISSEGRIARYESIIETSIAMRLAFTGLMLACCYGGALFRMSGARLDRVLAVATVGMIGFVYTMHGSRMGVLYGGSFWVSAYLATHVYLSGARPGSDRPVLMVGFAAVLMLLGLSTLAMVIRYTATNDVDWERMIADPFTFVGVFALWFDEVGFHGTNLLYGGRLFRRIYELVGISHELQPAIAIGYTSSNIYTVFRDLIEDFGSIGALGFMFFYGFGARCAFAAAAAGRAAALPWLAFVYAFALTSFASGMLSYTTSTLAILLFVLSYRFVARSESAMGRPLRPA